MAYTWAFYKAKSKPDNSVDVIFKDLKSTRQEQYFYYINFRPKNVPQANRFNYIKDSLVERLGYVHKVKPEDIDTAAKKALELLTPYIKNMDSVKHADAQGKCYYGSLSHNWIIKRS